MENTQYGEQGIQVTNRQLGFQGEETVEDSEDEEYGLDPESIMQSDHYENRMTLDMLCSDHADMDEFKYFWELIQRMSQANIDAMRVIVDKLSEAQQDFLNKTLHTRKLQISMDGEQMQVTRRVIKVKRKA